MQFCGVESDLAVAKCPLGGGPIQCKKNDRGLKTLKTYRFQNIPTGGCGCQTRFDREMPRGNGAMEKGRGFAGAKGPTTTNVAMVTGRRWQPVMKNKRAQKEVEENENCLGGDVA